MEENPKEEDQKEWFDFIEYMRKYSPEGIDFIFFNKVDDATSVEDLINKDIDIEMFERFYQRKWKVSGLPEKYFIEEQLEFLNSFSKERIESVKVIFYHWRSFIERKKALILSDLSNSKAKEPEIPESGKEIKKLNYETDTLKEIFLPDAILNYIDAEKRLIADRTIDNNIKFISKKGNKQKLIGLIYFLMDRKYLKPKFVGKSAKNNFNIYRRYFEKRYQTTLAEMARKFDNANHKDLHQYFSMFIPILKD